MDFLQQAIFEQAGESELHILEAGCGNKWPIKLKGIDYSLTGVDLKHKFGDLDEYIVGDLRTVNLGQQRFDVIYNSFVLEHVPDAERVLENFCKWLKPGGVILLRIPERSSVYGFVARKTPFWFHVFYLRYMRGIETAGKEGYGPYPTVHDEIVSRCGIHQFCAANGFVVKEEFGQNFDLERAGISALFERMFVRVASLISFGRLSSDHNNLTFVMQKQPSSVE